MLEEYCFGADTDIDGGSLRQLLPFLGRYETLFPAIEGDFLIRFCICNTRVTCGFTMCSCI